MPKDNMPKDNISKDKETLIANQERDRQRAAAMGGTFVMTFPRCFSDEQIEELRTMADLDNKEGTVADPGAEKFRRSSVHWLDRKKYKWVYDEAWRIARKANERYRFDIKPIQEMIQLSIYDESVQGFYTWHTDSNIYNMTRKISISIPLSGPSEYVGGEFQIMLGASEVWTVPQLKGAPIVFPSFERHQVKPVTRGRRYSLVIWVDGPPWR
jgi:PKHD-type hydroxylase